MINIFCKNNGQTIQLDNGTTIEEVYNLFKLNMDKKPVCAIVNNKVQGLRYRIFNSKTIEFLDITNSYGRKVYMRSMMFVLYKALNDIYHNAKLSVEAPISRSYFFKVSFPHTVGEAKLDITIEVAQKIKNRMKEIIAEGYRFHRKEAPTKEVAKLFREKGMEDKAKLIEGVGNLYATYYELDDTIDFYYGPLVPSTSYLNEFDLVKYYDGLLLRIPREEGKMPEILKQEKMLKAFEEDHILEKKIGITTVGELNEFTRNGFAGDAIKLSEALQEKKIAQIADIIASREQVRVVLVAGPSSSGKTTFSKRLCIQLMTCGLKPKLISLDNYFVDREHTPKDENGDYDYESIYSLNLELYQKHLTQLLNGEEIELPEYNFPTGKSVNSGEKLKLEDNTILVMEGIHGLNPLMTDKIPEENKFKIYISALTSIKLDDHNYIPSTDNRLIRRIIRDKKFRGASAKDTIARWPSVRRGETKWIFPYQENADVMFNSAMIYELAVLRDFALPILEAVHEDCEEHTMASSLAQFLRFFEPIPAEELPPTSLLREFLGGSSFKY